MAAGASPAILRMKNSCMGAAAAASTAVAAMLTGSPPLL
jgi:hypothetical protein